jgi:hypothetical protein
VLHDAACDAGNGFHGIRDDSLQPSGHQQREAEAGEQHDSQDAGVRLHAPAYVEFGAEVDDPQYLAVLNDGMAQLDPVLRNLRAHVARG